MLEFVDYGLHFIRDENNFIELLQVGSGSRSNEKSTGSVGPKINGSEYFDNYPNLTNVGPKYLK